MTEATTAARPLRGDIQGLRALAVGAVVVYHLLPSALPGGFTGVDVFFVISGFLITSHLLSHPPTGVLDLVRFWARRVRRLLPAALTVLVAVLLATRLVAPDAQWDQTARQARAAALYWENWALARQAVDYLAADNAPTAVQHFWSLSVEEQFYAFWPILLIALVLLARRARLPLGRLTLGALVLVVLVSLAFSIRITQDDPAAAYFVTQTRLWELAVGAVVAAWFARHAVSVGVRPDPDPTLGGAHVGANPVRAGLLAWAGLVAIVASCLWFSGKTPFPGWAALLPTLGAAAVIAAHADRSPWSPTALLDQRPMRWLGDISYAVYLWHWPLIILVPYVSGDSLGWLDRVAIILATLVLAQLTKVLIEDPMRRFRPQARLVWPFLTAAAGIAVVLGLVGAQLTELSHQEQAAQARRASALTGDAPCIGAKALAPGAECPSSRYDDLLLPPASALKDMSKIYPGVKGGHDCQAQKPDFPSVECVFGRRHAPTTVFLVGNSHAGQWLPALETLARRRDWRIVTRIASGCVDADNPETYDTAGETQACQEWGRRTTQEVIDARPDLVIMSHRMTWVAAGEATLHDSVPAYQQGAVTALQRWAASGIPVVIIRDTPAPGASAPQCVAEHADDLEACSAPRAAWLPADPFVEAVKEVAAPSIRMIDLNDWICSPARCSDVVGDVIVYFDGWHLSATYARTLADPLEDALRRVGRLPR